MCRRRWMATLRAPNKRGQAPSSEVDSRGKADAQLGASPLLLETLIALMVLFECAPIAAQVESPTAKSPAAGVDWPDFLGPNRDSQSPEKGLLTKWPAEGPPIVWKRELGTGYATCVIKKGRLYQFDRDGDHARLVALASETGKEVWKFEYKTEYDDLLGYDNGPRCSPVVDDERVYIFGPEGMLHALGVTTGKPVWTKDTKAEFGVVQNFFGVGSTPVLEGELLIAMVGGSPKDSPPNVYAGGVSRNRARSIFIFRTGRRFWRASTRATPWSLASGCLFRNAMASAARYSK
jgi:hypothetical protein